MKVKTISFLTLLGASLAFASPPAQAAGRTIVVTTTNNVSPPAGSVSLFQAIGMLADGDTITFNIPGTGPHVIITPLGGYPLITANNVTIDGYSQPGASPNSNSILGGNNAKIQIVLDSSDDASGPSKDPSNALLLERRSTRLPYPGYGDSENAILGVLAADGFKVKGISFLGRLSAASTGEQGDEDAGDPSIKDPKIYAIALIQEALNAKVQGCWFGLAPDGTTVKPLMSAVSGYRYRATSSDPYVYSSGLVFGTDGDKTNDVSEFNIAIGCHIAVAIELPNARISGNYFNVFPNGLTFYDVAETHNTLETLGFSGGDASTESIENGRFGDNTVIGTNGDGNSDANERNIFAHSYYDTDIEFYGGNAAKNVVVAGNYFGVGIDGTTTQPPLTDVAPGLISLPDGATIRVGSNGDRVSDDIEGNVIYNVPGSGFVEANANSALVARRNKMVNNMFQGFPFADGQNGRDYVTYYANALANSAAGVQPVITSITQGIMSGTVPAPGAGYTNNVIDIYVIDSAAEANGVTLPGVYAGSFVEGSAQDSDPAANAFKFNLIGSTIAPGAKVVIAVTYSKGAASQATNAVTGPLSAPVEAGIPDVIPGSIESVGLTRIVPDRPVILPDDASLGNWEPYASVLGNSHFLIEGHTFALGTTDQQRSVVAIQPVAGGPSQTVAGFFGDNGQPYTDQFSGSRQNGNPGRVAGDKRPGALNYLVGSEGSPHAIQAFKSDNRWNLGFDRIGTSLDSSLTSGEGRYGVVQTFRLNPTNLTVTPLGKAIDAINGRLTSGTAPGEQLGRFGGEVAGLDNGNFVVVVDDRSNVRNNGTAATAVILAPDGSVVKDSFLIGPGELWSNVAAYKGGFAVRLAGIIHFFDNAGNKIGQVDQSTSGESFDRNRGDGTRIASHINSPYVFLTGRVAADNVIRVAVWDSRDQTFVTKADVSEGAFTGGFDRANLAVDALNRLVVTWVSQPSGYEANQVAARVMAFDENAKAITPLTKSFLPFINAAQTGGIRTLQMSPAMTTKQIMVAAKGEINLQNQPNLGADSPREINFFTVFSHPAPADDPTAPVGGGGATLKIAKAGANSILLSWTGGSGPFLVQRKSLLTDAQWMNVGTTSDTSMTVPNDGTTGFFRVMNNATTTVVPMSLYMSGAFETPAVTTSGVGRGTVSLEENKLSFDIKYSGLSGVATLAHIHGYTNTTAPAGVIINLASFNGGAFGASGRLYGSTNLTDEQKTRLLAGDTYVNIHTDLNKSGEIRGQLSPASLQATLNGANEKPDPVVTTATGNGKFTLVGNDLFVDLSYQGLSSTANNAHIHNAPPETFGGVIVDMSPLHIGAFGTSGQFKGSVVLKPADLSALIDGNTYFNIHSTARPSGEIRGQIVP